MTEVHQIGQWLVEQIRDTCVSEVDRLIDGRVKGKQGKAWRVALQTMDAEQAMRALMPDVVDAVIFELLYKVDEGSLDLHIAGPPALATEGADRGEYAGWFEGDDGWRHWYAKQRFNEYYTDL